MSHTRPTETPDRNGAVPYRRPTAGTPAPPSRRQGRGAPAAPPSRRRRVDRRKRRSARSRLVRALAVLVGAGTLAGAAWTAWPQEGAGPSAAPLPGADDGPAEREPGRDPAATPRTGPPSSAPARPARPRSDRKPSRRQVSYVVDGPQTYTWAQGTGRRAGDRGRLIRYGVKLEDGTGLTADAVATEIDGILRDPRGWTRQGAASFQRVSSPPYDMVVHVVSPGTTDKLCGRWGLDTGGRVNCANAPDLVVNVRRWTELSPQYPDRPHDYHALIINHEVGHVLGYGHRGCPGAGEPAPAMMQQIKGLKGCRANPWVYDAEGRFIDGPREP